MKNLPQRDRLGSNPFAGLLAQRSPGSLGLRDAADPGTCSLLLDLDGPTAPALVVPRGPTSSLSPPVDTTPEEINRLFRKHGAVAIQDRPDLFFDHQIVPRLAAVFRRAVSLAVRILPLDLSEEQQAGGYLGGYHDYLNVIQLDRGVFDHPRRRGVLELWETTAHELFHALQNEPILKQAIAPEARKRLIDEDCATMSEDEFVQRSWAKELEAEEFALECGWHYRANFTPGSRSRDLSSVHELYFKLGRQAFAEKRGEYDDGRRQYWRAVHEKKRQSQ